MGDESIYLIESFEDADSNEIDLFMLFMLVMYFYFRIFLLDISFSFYRFIEKCFIHTINNKRRGLAKISSEKSLSSMYRRKKV